MSASPQPEAAGSPNVEVASENQAPPSPPKATETDASETPRRLAFPPRPDNPPAAIVPTVHAEESGSESEDDGLGHLAAEDSGSESDNDAEEAYAPESGKPKKSRKSGERKERKKKEKRAERPVEEVEDEDMEPTYDEATREYSVSTICLCSADSQRDV